MTTAKPKSSMKHYSIHRDMVVSYRKIDIRNEYALHWHDYIEIELITKGHGTHDLNGKESEATPGLVYILRPSDFHNLSTHDKMELYNISISESALHPETLERLARYGKGVCTELNSDELKTASQLAELMQRELKSETPNNQILQNLLDCFIITVLKKIPALSCDETVESDPINQALTYINMHFINDPSLKEVSAVAHYNPSHFSTRFKETVGVSYSDYLTDLKLKYSKRLLVSTELKISEVAFKSGFSSQSNFLRTFKAKIGTSPLKFRNKYRK